MDAKQLLNKYSLEPEDLPVPKATVVEIEGVDTEYGFDRETKQEKAFHKLYLKGVRVPLRLNSTRVRLLIYMLGEDTNLWVGRKIGLYTALGDHFGKMKPLIHMHDVAIDDQPLTAWPPELQPRPGTRAFGSSIQNAFASPGRPALGAASTANQGGGFSRSAFGTGAKTVANTAGHGAATGGGFTDPAAKGPAFDTRPIGKRNAERFGVALAEQGAKLDECLAWMKKHVPEIGERCYGRELVDWPTGAAASMQRFLKDYATAPVTTPDEPHEPPAEDPGEPEPTPPGDIAFDGKGGAKIEVPPDDIPF